MANNTPDNREWEVSAKQIGRAHGYSTPENGRRMNDNARAAAELASEILKYSRDVLLINMRFLESAFIRLAPDCETSTADIATDGRFLFYNSAHVCRSFAAEQQRPVRDYLHAVLHCVFLHPFAGPKVISELWDLACDIAVENVIGGLGLKCLYCAREEKQRWLLDKLRDEMPHISAERVYKWLRAQDLPPSECARLREAFYADDHQVWYRAPETKGGSGRGESRGDMAQTDADEAEMSLTDDQGAESPFEEDKEAGSESSGGGAAADKKHGDESGLGSAASGSEEKTQQPALTPAETKELWQKIARRAEVDLETFANSWGQNAGGMLQALEAVSRERCDYASFLRRFAVLGENMQLNDEEFDYIFYTYGISLYGNMPLIEPLEYKEVKRVREFVIALDTSESVAGAAVQKFVQKTWNILKQTENFFTKVNVHIIQCGAKIEEDAKITTQDEFDAYMRRMTLKGLGGTDFRPVFTYVEELIEKHEFTNLKGMIYFTDGCGDFPAMPPRWDTAFVFIEGPKDPPKVPAWAMKVVLSDEEIEAPDAPAGYARVSDGTAGL